MGNSITGVTTINVGGEVRTLVCDMHAGEELYQQHGEHWTLWLAAKFVGIPVTLEGGRKGRKMEPLSPAETFGVLYALLSSDRIDRAKLGRVSESSIGELQSAVGFGGFANVREKVTRSVIASFGVPGEAIEVVADAADGPRGSRHAATHGTGIAR